jgi:hypothetical protein
MKPYGIAQPRQRSPHPHTKKPQRGGPIAIPAPPPRPMRRDIDSKIELNHNGEECIEVVNYDDGS